MAIFPKNYCTISIKLNHFFLLQRVVSQKGGWDGWPVAIWKRKKILNNPINFVLWIKVNVCIALLWIVNFTYIVQFTLASHIMFFNIHHHQRTSTHTLCTVGQCTVCSANSVHGTSQYLKDICHNPMFENAPLKDRWRLSHTAPAALPRTRQDVPGHENILSDVPTSWLSHCIVEYDRSTWL